VKLRRVHRYEEPKYPTQAYLRDHPELLRYVPKRWQDNRLVLGALSLALPLVLACQGAGDQGAHSGAGASRIAPLFVHGDGRGAFGCVVVNPPVFLSEDEARQVIQEEAKKAGLEFAADALTLKGVDLPVTSPFEFAEEMEAERTWGLKKKKAPPTHKGDLVLDGYDEKRKIAFEIVSPADFEAWQRQEGDNWCSVSSYDFKKTAERLRAGLARDKSGTTVGVFYEPGTYPPEPTVASMRSQDLQLDELLAEKKARAKTGKAMSETELRDRLKALGEAHVAIVKKSGEEELRAQMRDFLQWLKAQGVI